MTKPLTDIHIHHVPAGFVRFVESASAYGTKLDAPRGEDVRLTIGSLSYGLNRTFFDIERLIRRMAEMRVDRAVLSVATPFVRFDVPTSLAVEAAQTYNDEISAVRKAAPDRFEAWAYLPILDPELAARELTRAVKSLGLIGGYLPSNVNGRYLDANELSPVFRTAAELDVPLFVHPSNPPARERMNRYELPVVAGYLFDTTINIFQMIFGGLFDRHPTLRLCCTHLGGYAPLLQGRMQRELDTNPDLATRLKQPLGNYLRMIHYDTICFEPSYLRAAIESKAVDPKRLLLGSDTPFPLGEPDPVGFIERTFSQVGDSFADSIMRDNPVALLKSSGDRIS
jgi:aminocarboxymuconate-semialdehyde decarboxylase